MTNEATEKPDPRACALARHILWLSYDNAPEPYVYDSGTNSFQHDGTGASVRFDAVVEALAAELYEDGEGLYGEGVSYDTCGGEFAVLTDDEADLAWDAALDSYLDDCVLPDLPGTLQHYFDRDAWKRDARHDGRGHCLSPYDGTEYEERDPDTGECFYIYRTS